MLHKILLFSFLTLSAFAQDDVAEISEAMGHLIGKNLQALGLEVDMEALVKGLKQEAVGVQSPMSEEECLKAVALLQEVGMKKVAEKNLIEANSFLKKNAEKKEVISAEGGKLQYEILQKGEGEEVRPYNAPLVRLHGRWIHGEFLSEKEEIIALDNTITGFSKGLIGMKEGEKRTLYIHPDLAYGKEGNFQPNALLIFDVELLKADVSFASHSASKREIDPVIFDTEENEEPKIR